MWKSLSEKEVNCKTKLLIAACCAVGPIGYKSLKDVGLKRLLQNKLKECGVKTFQPESNLAKLKRYGIKAITLYDKQYPDCLKEIASPPTVLFYIGQIGLLQKESLAIVGSRKVTDYGRSVTEDIGNTLAEANILITSGLALGVDTIAHRCALKYGGPTIAVLANGLEKIYPGQNRELAADINKNGGLIISEYPPETPPLRQYFAIRNRIVAGISKGIIVTQANLKSGALITASFGIEQNKDIFSVPGPIYSPAFEGNNKLLKMGANVVTSPNDILEFYGITTEEVKASCPPKNKIEKEIFEILENESHINEIIRKSSFSPGEISATLTIMEIKGRVKHLGAGVYKKGN